MEARRRGEGSSTRGAEAGVTLPHARQCGQPRKPEGTGGGGVPSGLPPAEWSPATLLVIGGLQSRARGHFCRLGPPSLR